MRGCGRIGRPAFPAPSDVSGRNFGSELAHLRRDRGGVSHLRATSFCTLQPHRRSSSLPHLWGGWTAEGRAGGGLSAERILTSPPTPASALLWPTLPTKGGGIRKSELRSTFPRTRGEVKNGDAE